jgi:hypothetical protein
MGCSKTSINNKDIYTIKVFSQISQYYVQIRNGADTPSGIHNGELFIGSDHYIEENVYNLANTWYPLPCEVGDTLRIKFIVDHVTLYNRVITVPEYPILYSPPEWNNNNDNTITWTLPTIYNSNKQLIQLSTIMYDYSNGWETCGQLFQLYIPANSREFVAASNTLIDSNVGRYEIGLANDYYFSNKEGITVIWETYVRKTVATNL